MRSFISYTRSADEHRAFLEELAEIEAAKEAKRLEPLRKAEAQFRENATALAAMERANLTVAPDPQMARGKEYSRVASYVERVVDHPACRDWGFSEWKTAAAVGIHAACLSWATQNILPPTPEELKIISMWITCNGLFPGDELAWQVVVPANSDRALKYMAQEQARIDKMNTKLAEDEKLEAALGRRSSGPRYDDVYPGAAETRTRDNWNRTDTPAALSRAAQAEADAEANREAVARSAQITRHNEELRKRNLQSPAAFRAFNDALLKDPHDPGLSNLALEYGQCRGYSDPKACGWTGGHAAWSKCLNELRYDATFLKWADYPDGRIRAQRIAAAVP